MCCVCAVGSWQCQCDVWSAWLCGVNGGVFVRGKRRACLLWQVALKRHVSAMVWSALCVHCQVGCYWVAGDLYVISVGTHVNWCSQVCMWGSHVVHLV